ncbi:MAG: hypothetical protein WCG87_08615, partial [Bacteroidota bacterium]
QPSLAALRMRSSVEQFLVDDVHEGNVRSGLFEKLGNSLGAMGFLIDMLSYQRTLAKKLFISMNMTIASGLTLNELDEKRILSEC